MQAEHCSNAGFDCSFTTPNYGFTTTPRQEWMIIVEGAPCPPENLRHGRKIQPLEELVALGREQAGLWREEVIATVDYTGPMVRFWNRARP